MKSIDQCESCGKTAAAQHTRYRRRAGIRGQTTALTTASWCDPCAEKNKEYILTAEEREQKMKSRTMAANPLTFGDQDPHHLAARRAETFRAEIESADPITAQQLLAAWKEIIIENFLKAVHDSTEPKDLELLDSQAGLMLALHHYRSAGDRARKEDR